MHVITKKRLKEFWEKHPDAEVPLRAWHSLIQKGVYTTPHELREAFPTVDFVGNGRAIFDIGGNKYRLVADVRYEIGRVFIVKVMTHAEYDRADVTRL